MELVWLKFILIISFLLEHVVNSTASTDGVVVDSPFGRIRGARKTVEKTGQEYLSFSGVPYAKPPVGRLRFAKPQPHPKIDGLFDASKDFKTSCLHPYLLSSYKASFQEDCLILNILTKDIHVSGTLRKVLVFIHGGAFVRGSAGIYDGKSFVLSQDVIVVTVNYRLGVLGFLSTENEASPGNYGLWDQTLAIKWVKDNIRAFGGNPDDITIAGESAGGMSVGLQVLSPHAKGLFTKAFQQSGTGSSVFSQSINAQSHALVLAKSLSCWQKDVGSKTKISIQESEALIECLRNKPTSAFTEFHDFIVSETRFVPRVDGDFIPDLPSKLLQDDKYLDSIGFFDRFYLVALNNGEFTVTDYKLTVTKNAIFAIDQLSEEQKESMLASILAATKNLYIKSRLGLAAIPDKSIVNVVDEFYRSRLPDDKTVLEIVGDLNFLIPSLDFLMAVSRRDSGSSYLLYFDHFPHFMKGKYRGTAHMLDMAYWFDMDFDFLNSALALGILGEFNENDVRLKESFSSLVGDFMKTGDPGVTLNKNLPSGEWPKYDVTNSSYLRFNTKPWVSHFLEKDRQELWLDTLPRMIQEEKKKQPRTQVHEDL